MVKWLLTSLAVPPDVLLRLAHVENTGEAEQPSTTLFRIQCMRIQPLFFACDFSSPQQRFFVHAIFHPPQKNKKNKKNNPKP